MISSVTFSTSIYPGFTIARRIGFLKMVLKDVVNKNRRKLKRNEMGLISCDFSIVLLVYLYEL